MQSEKLTTVLFLLSSIKEDAQKFTAPQLTTTSKRVLVESMVNKIELAEEELHEAMTEKPVDVVEDEPSNYTPKPASKLDKLNKRLAEEKKPTPEPIIEEGEDDEFILE